MGNNSAISDIASFVNDEQNINKASELVRDGIEDAITQDKIKSAQIKQENTLRDPAYVIDLCGVAVQPSVLNCFKIMVDPRQTEGLSGDDIIALYLRTDTGVYYTGNGSTDMMYKVLLPYIRCAIGDINVYYNKGGKLKKLLNTGVISSKLDL